MPSIDSQIRRAAEARDNEERLARGRREETLRGTLGLLALLAAGIWLFARIW